MGVFLIVRTREGGTSTTPFQVAHFALRNTKNKIGGERGIRTLDTGLAVYTLSRRAPSATRPPLL